MTRRKFLAAAGLAASARAQSRPNVLVFLTDQESEVVEREALRLPNRDRLETSGVRFTRNWCTTPQCSPARSSILTGRYPHNTGVRGNVGAAGGDPLRPRDTTLGDIFQSAGYRSGYFGKWHLSGGGAGWEDHGFEATRVEGRTDADVTAAATRWIASVSEEPWLCVVSLIQPHDIYFYPRAASGAESEGRQMPIRRGVEPPRTTAADLESRPAPQGQYNEQDQGQVTANYTPEDWQRYRSFYYDLVEDADRNLGKLLDAIDLQNTITVYTSDHGDGLGSHGLAFKGPFLYEELLRVPLVISWPGHFREGSQSREFASQVDILPTLCDLVGLETPSGVDGQSLRTVLEGGRSGLRDANFAEYYSKQRWVNPARAVRTDRWKLVETLGQGRELYDLKSDPIEANNLAGARADKESELLAKLDEWAAETTDAEWLTYRATKTE